jgi:peptidoglycan/LPS O-acetylase OafA/YrhL
MLQIIKRLSTTTTSPHARGLPYRPDIDGLRALAVVAVVAFHASPHAMPGGFVGVDVFFVISGYLITGLIVSNLEAGRFSFAEFYARRFRRLVPALVVVLLSTWLLGWFLLLPEELSYLGKHIVAGATFTANLVLAREAASYFDYTAELKPLLHLWSLGVEEQFYLIWPALLVVTFRYSFRIPIIIAGLLAASLLLNLTYGVLHAETAFYLLPTRFWELLLGAALIFVERATPPVRSWSVAFPDAKAGAGLVLIIASSFLINQNDIYPGWLALIPTIGALLLISAGQDAWLNNTVLSARPVVLVGLISYPLYLWHWPLLSFARLLGTSREIRVGVVIVSILLAWITYVLVEQPIRTIRINKQMRSRAVLGFCGVLAVVASIGWVTLSNDGFVERLPPEARALGVYDLNKWGAEMRVGTCFIAPEQGPSAFDSRCGTVANDSGERVLLWGDSHAAHLYPGLVSLLKDRKAHLSEYTASACPPLIDTDTGKNPNCGRVNEFVISQMPMLRPDLVIMAARWGQYDLSRLGNTIARLRATGVANIVLVGPVPEWEGTPRNDVLRSYLHTKAFPERTAALLQPELDEQLARSAANLRIAYISAYKALCKSVKCIVFWHGQPTVFDKAHFTAEGSKYFVGIIAPQLGF